MDQPGAPSAGNGSLATAVDTVQPQQPHQTNGGRPSQQPNNPSWPSGPPGPRQRGSNGSGKCRFPDAPLHFGAAVPYHGLTSRPLAVPEQHSAQSAARVKDREIVLAKPPQFHRRNRQGVA